MLLLLFVSFCYAFTVRDAVTAGCETKQVAGLTRQLVSILNQMEPGTFTDLTTSADAEWFSLGPSTQPFLQTAAAAALGRAARSRGRKIVINSALRSLPQQVLLYSWYRAGRCGIKLAAKPGNSNHQSGAAVDVDDYTGWQSYLVKQGWRWFGLSDKVHFDFVAGDARFKRSAILSFQKLWNVNNPTKKLAENGVYSDSVQNAILDSPAAGFTIATVDGVQQPQPQPQPTDAPVVVNNNPPKCSFNGVSGTCIDASSCTGTAHRGLCAGSASIQCCIVVDQQPQPQPTDAPVVVNNNAPKCTFNGVSGTCIDASSCRGTTHRGLCPGAASIQCCIEPQAATPIELPVARSSPIELPVAPAVAIAPTCKFNGVSGTCIDSSTCTGTSHRGLCAGAANIQCCIVEQNVVAPTTDAPATQAPVVVNNDAPTCTVNGVSGSCISVTACQGTPHRGFCTGPSTIQCCIPDGATAAPTDAPVIGADGIDWRVVIKAMTSSAKSSIVDGLANAMPQLIQNAQLTTPLRQAHFLAQLAHESASFITTVEFASGSAYEGRRDLGNTQRGDGVRYKGRGLIQLTGRANYAKMSTVFGVDFVGNPELAAQFPWAALTCGEYWKSRSINKYADLDDVVRVTRLVNGGLNGLSDRKLMLSRAKAAIAKFGNAGAGRATIDTATVSETGALPQYAIGAIAGSLGTLVIVAIVVVVVMYARRSTSGVPSSKFSSKAPLLTDSQRVASLGSSSKIPNLTKRN